MAALPSRSHRAAIRRLPLPSFITFQHHLASLCSRSLCLAKVFFPPVLRLYRWLIRSLPGFWLMLLYFVILSLAGFFSMKLLAPRITAVPAVPADLDLFFMSVSAVTVSSMSTAEMGDLSSGQLVVLAVLMLVGGEVFTSMVDLHVMEAKLSSRASEGCISDKPPSSAAELADYSALELGSMPPPGAADKLPAERVEQQQKQYSSLRMLSAAVFVYLILAHVAGSVAILLYIIFNSTSARVLRERGVSDLGFSTFMAVSSFANAGFIPLNDGMGPFKQAPGLLLLIIPLVLAGNALFPPILRAAIWMLRTRLGSDAEYILGNDDRAIAFNHLLPSKRSTYLVWTVAAFIGLQVFAFCWMEWGGLALDGLNNYQKLAGGLYMAVNSRHAGESPFDLSAVSAAVLVLFVVMMYLPAYTTFLPEKDDGDGHGGGEKIRRSSRIARILKMSPILYISIFIILICITERRKLAEDPMNFNVLNIVVEVTSAYGNVGFSTGYACARWLKQDGSCKDAGYGFAGWWSGGGKVILIVVMFFGRLKKFYMEMGDGAWKLG